MDKWISVQAEHARGSTKWTNIWPCIISRTARARCRSFSDILSNWYVRRGRERYWGSEMTDDKAAAYTTLWHVPRHVREAHRALYAVHRGRDVSQSRARFLFGLRPSRCTCARSPPATERRWTKALEKGMDSVLDIVNLGRAARNAGNVKNRQPLSEMYVVTAKDLGSGRGPEGDRSGRAEHQAAIRRRRTRTNSFRTS